MFIICKTQPVAGSMFEDKTEWETWYLRKMNFIGAGGQPVRLEFHWAKDKAWKFLTKEEAEFVLQFAQPFPMKLLGKWMPPGPEEKAWIEEVSDSEFWDKIPDRTKKRIGHPL